MNKSLNILGFDPASLVNLGWAHLILPLNEAEVPECEAGTFVFHNTDQKTTLASIYSTVDSLIAKNNPDLVIVEKTSSFSGGFITGQVSACLGVLLAVMGKHKVDIVEVFPTHVKKVVTGNGRATKKLIKTSIVKLLKGIGFADAKFSSEHAYDAMANIFCHLIDSNIIKLSKEGETDE